MQTTLMWLPGVLAGMILQLQSSAAGAGEPDAAGGIWPATVIRTDACPGGLTLIDNPHTERYLGMLLPDDRLQHLELQGCPLSAEACRLIGECSNLEVLELAGSSLSDRGVAELAELIALRRLDLRGTRISDEALEHVGQLAGLECLDLRGTGVFTDAIRRLQARRPGLVILFDRRSGSRLAGDNSQNFRSARSSRSGAEMEPARSEILHAMTRDRHRRAAAGPVAQPSKPARATSAPPG